jgi:hypothetical protein
LPRVFRINLHHADVTGPPGLRLKPPGLFASILSTLRQRHGHLTAAAVADRDLFTYERNIGTCRIHCRPRAL